jgi:hypothetical protein
LVFVLIVIAIANLPVPKEEPSLFAHFFARFCVVIGLAIMWGGGALFWRTVRFLARAIPTTGEVSELASERISSRSRSGGAAFVYRPIVTFETATGGEIRFKASYASNPPGLKVGDEVAVLYDPKRPDQAAVRSFASLWLGALIAGAMGLIFTAVGAFMILRGYA